MKSEKKKFNIFDLLIGGATILVLALIAYMLFSTPTAQSAAQYNLEFVVEVPSTTLDILDVAKTGDTVTLSGKSQAQIIDINYSPAKKLALDQVNGEYMLSDVPEKYDIYAYVSAPASVNDKDISIGNMSVKVGTKMELQGRGYSFDGTIIDMTLYDENGEEIK